MTTAAACPYQVQYVFRAGEDREIVWLEDSGRWFAGTDGKPMRAHGVVRVVTARHEREAHADPDGAISIR